jgi:hypothetical protein
MNYFNKHAWKRIIGALFTVTAICSPQLLLAGDITEYANNDWLLAGYVWGTTEIVGSQPTDPDGSGCVSNYAVRADDPPWTFEVGPEGALLTVVDNWALTEKYHVYDNDIHIGDTSDPPSDAQTCYDDPENCLISEASKGYFALSEGNHSITMTVTTYNPDFLAGCLYFRIEGDIVGAGVDIEIDIAPTDIDNKVRLNSKGKLTVAVIQPCEYTVDCEYNAYEIDLNTLTFEGAAFEGGENKLWTFRDVNGDGIKDRLFKFDIQDTNIECGDTEATLSGRFLGGHLDGKEFSGTGTITTFGCK